ncbi:MAG TPA: BON domain-containing protein [Chloroflexota bacterium]|nr:BON domain-containing protein [Chloroflexota bacterium]
MKTRQRHFLRRTIILSAMAGVILEYFWDPGEGRHRRAVTRDQIRATLRRAGRRLGKQARYLEGEAYGMVEETVHLHRPDNVDPDDATLRDRIESQLFRDWAVPKGDINVNVAAGIVELRGQVDQPGEIDEIEQKVRHITGVRAIHNYLHVPGTAAPNKARVLAVS